MNKLFALFITVLFFPACSSTSLNRAASKAAPTATTSQSVATELSTTPQNPDLSLLDAATDPCENYFQYACGGWIKKVEIPADRPLWRRGFDVIDEKNQLLLKGVLENYASGKFEPQNPYAPQLGDLYASCMDESKLEAGAVKTLHAKLKEIDTIDTSNLAPWVASQRLDGIRLFFSISETQDAKHPEDVIAGIRQSGMALPTKEYYLSPAPQMVSLRDKYVKFIAKLLRISGESENQALSDAQNVLMIETQLAEGALTPVEMRDPLKTYHPLTPKALEDLAPAFDWKAYFLAVDLKNLKVIDVSSPNYLKAVNKVLTSTPLAALRAYFRFSVLSGSARGLPDRFYNENFEFFGKTLSGFKESPARWKRCVQASNELMGFALGRSFVSLTFSGSSKETAVAMIEQIEKTESLIIDQLAWMDAKTKRAAHTKLKNLVNHIGYPSVWRNYDALVIDRNSYLANRYAAARFATHYNLDKIDKPLNRNDWDMAPSAVNAYYDPQLDKMVFPAGIMQPPFFSAAYDQAANFGGIGMVVGHEMSHGFDDQGRHYDHNGAMLDWWSANSAIEFEKRASCLARQYDTYEVAGGGHLNGNLTLGEVIGDQGGLKVTYSAWLGTLPSAIRNNPEKLREEQKHFFLAYAQTWCSKETEAYEKLRTASDPHPPSRYRVNGSLTNLPGFAEAYQCNEAGKETKMAPKNRCTIW